MKQKLILVILAVVFFLLLAAGLALSILEGTKAPTPPETTPSQPAATTPGESLPQETTPVPTTQAPTTLPPTTPAIPVTTPASTTPPVTTPAPTTPPVTAPGHTHTYKGVVTAPTLKAEGYTTYTCACGHTYVADRRPVLTLQQHINQLPLNPAGTGISKLDTAARGQLAGSTTYDKLLAVHNFLKGCGQGPVQSSLAQMSAFAGNKVFQNITELKIAYDAYQVLTNRSGKAEHYAAAFTVAARALGLEAYVTSGTLNGAAWAWSSVRLGEELYYFDAFGGQDVFAKLPGEVPGYAGANMGGQSGFKAAAPFSITLETRTGGSSTARRYTWELDKAGTGNDDFLQNRIDLKLSGAVTYTITITESNGTVTLYDHTGTPKQGGTLTATVEPAAGSYTLLVEEQASGRSFRITIDN